VNVVARIAEEQAAEDADHLAAIVDERIQRRADIDAGLLELNDIERTASRRDADDRHALRLARRTSSAESRAERARRLAALRAGKRLQKHVNQHTNRRR